MGPVRQNPIQRTVRSVHVCTIVAHNIAPNRPDNFPSCFPDNHHCSGDVYLRERGLVVAVAVAAAVLVLVVPVVVVVYMSSSVSVWS